MSEIDIACRQVARLLNLTRPLLFVDTETTGVKPDTDRIVEIATLSIRPDGEARRWRQLVHPQRPIPPEATAVHKITDADVADAQPFSFWAPAVAKALTSCDVAGYGVRRFDMKLLAAEMSRARVPGFDIEAVTVVDAMEVFYRKEGRDLTAAARFYCGLAHEGAHGAMPDVEMTVQVLAAQLTRYEDLPRTAVALAEFGENRDPNAIDRAGLIVWRGDVATVAFGKHDGRPLFAVPPSYLNWMLDQDFGQSTMTIVREALAGRYPERPAGAT